MRGPTIAHRRAKGRLPMWGEIERSPVLAAPSFNDYVGLTATSTYSIGGEEDENPQAPNDLCEKYLPLAHKIARSYAGRGIDFEDLRGAAYLGLTRASRRFNPERGAFGPYAKFWISGEITALFKGNNPLNDAQSLTKNYEEDDESHQKDVAAPSPVIAPDLSGLAGTDRHIIESRLRGETLVEIGKTLGISAERVRQREVLSRSQLRGSVASQCISDLTRRGKVIKLPGEHTRREVEFRDREPPKHVYCEPQPSGRLVHHRANASRLADLRGRNPRGPYGGPVIHGWGRP
jgi:RNA polymerase sigma factor (sigma-70 family)